MTRLEELEEIIHDVSAYKCTEGQAVAAILASEREMVKEVVEVAKKYSRESGGVTRENRYKALSELWLAAQNLAQRVEGE